MTIQDFIKQLDIWRQGKTFGSVETLLNSVQEQAQKLISEDCIARFASVSGHGPGYCFVIGTDSPLCYLRVYTKTVDHKIRVERITFRSA